jgi:hypothetical protein
VSGAGVHLLAADDDVVARHRFGALIALCGEMVDEPGTLGGEDTRYCVNCATEAVRWSVAGELGRRCASEIAQIAAYHGHCPAKLTT